MPSIRNSGTTSNHSNGKATPPRPKPKPKPTPGPTGGMATVGADSLIIKELDEAGQDTTASTVERPNVKDRFADDLLGHLLDINTINHDPLNARLHNDRNLEAIKDSLCLFGQMTPVVVRRQNMTVMKGNGTLQSLREMGWTKIAAVVHNMTDAEAAAYGLADNRTAELATWNVEAVHALEELIRESKEFSGSGMVGFGLKEIAILRTRGWLEPTATSNTLLVTSLADRFVVPPFSVLDARQGYWQTRKRAWLALGIQSEIGRGENIVPNGTQDAASQDGVYRRNKVNQRISPGGGSELHPQPAGEQDRNVQPRKVR